MSFISRHQALVGIVIAIVLVGGGTLLYIERPNSSSANANTSLDATSSNSVAMATTHEMIATSTIGMAAAPSSASTVKADTTLTASAKVATAPVSNTAGMRFEVVTTTAAQQKGLSDRAVVPDNYAMLFAFPTDGDYGFWMIDMLVPLDMIWLNDDGVIVKIDADVSPATYPNVFYPPQPVKYVLETKAGFAAEKGWTIGTKVALPAPY